MRVYCHNSDEGKIALFFIHKEEHREELYVLFVTLAFVSTFYQSSMVPIILVQNCNFLYTGSEFIMSYT